MEHSGVHYLLKINKNYKKLCFTVFIIINVYCEIMFIIKLKWKI